ncbi:MAG: RluA family pseudouridine synthase [Spirochaetaceae bacterium]|jgi:23S rRNA pseudouridine955/2504/2580 synthase|nr:RluA family pseudouridine synthase [Spirochaetaceae bacterium]
MNLIAGPDDEGRRLDRLLRKALPHLPLSRIHRLLREGRVLVNGGAAAASLRGPPAALISLPGPAAPAPPAGQGGGGTVGRAAFPEILWKGRDLLALNKPAGLAVQGPGPALDGLVREYLADKLPPSLSFRPGPLHRLDRPTSGVIMFPLSLRGAQAFSGLLRDHRIVKRYLALAEGLIEGPETWEEDLFRDTGRRMTLPRREGEAYRRALTRAAPLGSSRGRTLLLLELETGRTHQIRAQAALHGHPLAGDRKYGGGPLPGGLLLHALSLEFPVLDPEERRLYPETAEELEGKTLCAPPPEGFFKVITGILGSAAEVFRSGGLR